MIDADVMRETLSHVYAVQRNMARVIAELQAQLILHDASKFSPEEFATYVAATPLLKGAVYGSEEYRQGVAALGPALEHHYKLNPHHPEHHAAGVGGMDLLYLIEMLCDWQAAMQRHDPPGTFARSMSLQVPRLGIGPQLESVLWRTIERLGWGSAERTEARSK